MHRLGISGAGVEQVISSCCGCYVCERVQEQIGQVLAKKWALKAWLNQPIIRQVHVSRSRNANDMMKSVKQQYKTYDFSKIIIQCNNTTILPILQQCY